MSKKHFIALAQYIKQFNNFEPGPFTPAQIKQLANFCAAQNPRFNRERWIDFINGECGPNGGSVKGAK